MELLRSVQTAGIITIIATLIYVIIRLERFARGAVRLFKKQREDDLTAIEALVRQIGEELIAKQTELEARLEAHLTDHHPQK